METKKQKNVQTYHLRTNREWFLHNLFTDSEYVKYKEEITSDIVTLLGKKGAGILLLTSSKKNGICDQLKEYSKYKSASLRRVLKPYKLELQFNKSSEAASIIRKIELLASKFQATISTTELGFKYRPLAPGSVFGSTPLIYIEDDNVIMRVDANTRLEDIKVSYQKIMELQSKLPHYQQRNRPSYRTDLIYAIYKQRLKKLSFDKIFELYSLGKLPEYNGAISIGSPDSLERRYNKYKPAI